MLFKRKTKQTYYPGAKIFEGKINLIEFVLSGKVVESFKRPQIVEKVFDNENNINNFINALTRVASENNNEFSEIYLNGININQVNKNYLEREIVVVEEVADENVPDVNLEIQKIELNEHVACIKNLNFGEKLQLETLYKQNPSIVIFNNFKTTLKEKDYVAMQNHLLNLFCDAIVIFISNK